MQHHVIRNTRRALGGSLLLGGALALAACGGGSSGSSGSLSLGVTDGPVEEADAVVVQFSSVTLKPAEGEPFTIELDPVESVDLLAQQNGNSELLLENESVPTGDYNWIRLGVDLGLDSNGDPISYIQISDDKFVLDCPSCAQTGLKLVSGFTVADEGTVNLTIDFDLRKSIVKPAFQDYKLKPALRLVNNVEAGEIAVTATGTYVSDNDCGSNEGGGGGPVQSVYVYEGSGVTPDDVDTSTDADIDPVTSAMITDEDGDGTYTGTAAFLPAGDYTVAYVCDAEDDEAEIDNSPLTYSDIRDVEVEAGETENYDLP